MLDPAHGGTESGAVLTPTILEKDVTLSFARRLRQDLTSHGIVVEMVRDADSNISTDDRAAKANAEHPLLYICLHASSLIGSTKLFSPVLQSADSSPGPFTAWDTAQQGSLSTGRALEQQLLPAFQKSGLSVRALEVAMRPLNNVTAPAIAIELAPRNAEISQLMSADYQAPISAAIATGIADSIPFLTASPTPSR